MSERVVFDPVNKRGLVRLGVDDLDALTQLELASQPVPWSDDQMLLELVHDDASVLGYRDQAGALVAYVAVRRMVDELWIMNVAVHPSARRRGIARSLLDASLTVAGQTTSLWLEVRESNAGARALYEVFGMREISRRREYYPPIPPSTTRETAIVMSRRW